MSISDLYMKSRISSRLLEEELYAEVLQELERGIRRDGLWAKAFAKSGANEEKAKALYIEFRVQALRDEIALYKIQLQEEQEKAKTAKTAKTAKQAKPLRNKARMAQNRVRASDDIQAREERIKACLIEKLGREPTASEIDKAKWDGMCL